MKHFQIEFIGLSCNIFTRVVVVYSKPELCKKKIVMRNVHAYTYKMYAREWFTTKV